MTQALPRLTSRDNEKVFYVTLRAHLIRLRTRGQRGFNASATLHETPLKNDPNRGQCKLQGSGGDGTVYL
jgi:hypothetical protein